jgi:glucokinase
MDNKNKVIIGIDLGGTDIKFGLFSSKVELIDTWLIKTPKFEILETIYKELSKTLDIKKIVHSNIIGLGIVVPAPIVNGVAKHFANTNIPDNTNIIKELGKMFNYTIKIVAGNDASMAAYGEFKSLSNDLKNIVFYTLGTGTGGGLIIDGKIVEGANGVASEFGHTIVDQEQTIQCGCGQFGCLEQSCSNRGVERLVKLYSNTPTKLTHPFTTKDVFDLAKKDDPLCLKVVDEFTRQLAINMVNLTMIVDPQIFIIGGGISKAGEFLINKIKSWYCKYQRFNIEPSIILANLGNDAGIYGAAYLVQDR